MHFSMHAFRSRVSHDGTSGAVHAIRQRFSLGDAGVLGGRVMPGSVLVPPSGDVPSLDVLVPESKSPGPGPDDPEHATSSPPTHAIEPRRKIMGRNVGAASSSFK